ncbi:heavy metal-associated domain-containing protein [Pedobacter sp. KR3-3]|uniref:Heavy metal-associated domain-containing protein n=1 Tax=Pedobacter albus TaxID=3113905 RepID=A0ABU7IB37_9SPHI|nr:heavy metal-associated domain-containing protein [Pedobacter sp. KR3-3]MEE1946496.1 heavy metal-associated domain-containing protein [Pedobacter sp. KR3-3]
MTHTYQVTGMTCSHCENKVKSNLLLLPEITEVEVSKTDNTAIITMDKHVGLEVLQGALGGPSSKYQISAIAPSETL